MTQTAEQRREKQAAHARAWRAANPEAARAADRAYKAAHADEIRERERGSETKRVYRLKRQHNMTPLEYEQLWESQDGKCYLCGDKLVRGKSTHIDHDHSCCGDGESCFQCRRGLACNPCNRIVGFAYDDPERLRRIADALERKLS